MDVSAVSIDEFCSVHVTLLFRFLLPQKDFYIGNTSTNAKYEGYDGFISSYWNVIG